MKEVRLVDAQLRLHITILYVFATIRSLWRSIKTIWRESVESFKIFTVCGAFRACLYRLVICC